MPDVDAGARFFSIVGAYRPNDLQNRTFEGHVVRPGQITSGVDPWLTT